MVPVELRLRNFLSYGEAAPTLDFEGLRVACLSGGNGQGKSALLDAITWALWGEARKSSDLRKPDEELLRVGAREMQVDLTFQLDETRYRVVRSYVQSASGKTSKPGLEFQVGDAAGGWSALTAESVRATQAILDARLGIDYETFINSTFLLQGRSDEFTKKKPGERKEILTKILGLDRYDRLAGRAGARWSALRETADRLEREAERLVASLEPVDGWTAERAEVQAVVEGLNAEAEAARVQEATAAERIAGLDAAAREAEIAQHALNGLRERSVALDAEIVQLDGRIGEADALVAGAATIESDHTRYEALRTERTQLDEKAALFRGLDSQRQSLVLDLQRETAAREADVARLDARLAALRDRAQTDETRVASRDRIRAKADAAQASADTVRTLDVVRQRRRRAQEGIDRIDKKLAETKGALDGKLARLREEGRLLHAALKTPDPTDAAALRRAADSGREASEAMDTVREEGTALAARVQALGAALTARAEEEAALQVKLDRISTSTDDTCPTCGTPLTEAHRDEVARTYRRELSALVARQSKDRAEQASLDKERAALRERYAALQSRARAGQEAAEALAAHAAREAARQADQQRLDGLRVEAEAVQAELAGEAFDASLRAERAGYDDELSAHPFDEVAFEKAKAEASLRDHWLSELRDLDVAAERLAQTRTEAERLERDLATRREALAQGAHAAPIRARLAAIDAQVQSVGYDAAHHERVARELDRLAEAPRKLAALLDARRRLAEWTERRAAAREEVGRVHAEATRKEEALAALAARLAERDAAFAARDAARTARADVARRLAEAQAQRGALDERLSRAASDRESLMGVRRELRETKQQRALYGHLRRAFGKHGIPSLIVEETLPEVEVRANELLDRLSGGRTRVALETLKDRKTGGGTKETLDIRITDAQGVARAYETYSGGEAFRVNFALRIALSQMLAERSGTRIRTLVIDEGFGTQDREGLQALIGAIRAIQDDFDLILVITHLEELKAAFPVRIEVRKEPVTGSTFEIVGV